MPKAEYPNISISKYLIIDFLFVFCKKGVWEAIRLSDLWFRISEIHRHQTSDIRNILRGRLWIWDKDRVFGVDIK
jgi:hypothetical protein